MCVSRKLHHNDEYTIMDNVVKIKFKPTDKKLVIDLTDPALNTPFQQQLIGELLTSIQDILKDHNEYRFVYFKNGPDDFGWKAVKKESD